MNFGSKIWTINFEMSETIEDLRNENFRLKLREGSHWQTNQIANFSMITFYRIYHLEMDKVQTEKVIHFVCT